MNRLLPLLAIGLAAAGVAIAHETNEGAGDGESVKVIAAHDMIEKLDGAETTASVVEVTIAPGQEGAAHRHPGPGIVYVIEGTYELGIDDQPTKIFKAGESFYEPSGCLHRVSRNPSSKERTRLVAVVIHPRDAKEVAIPEPVKK
jgi:quercetin dioxygenase-like cupin family protein